MSLPVLGKSILIAFVGTIVVWVYASTYLQYAGTDQGFPSYHDKIFQVALLGNFVIGLPIALLVFWLAHKHLVRSPTTLAMVSVLAGIMMILASFAMGDSEAVLALGLPAFVAALTYGLLGWFWILRPMRKSMDV